jgi:hypothetical protein
MVHPGRIARLSVLAVALACGAAQAQHSPRVDQLLSRAYEPTVRALRTSPDALRALQKLVEANDSRVSLKTLEAVLATPSFAPFAANTLRDLAQVKNIPGVERVVQRLVGVPGGQAAGASYEINVAARYGQDLAEMSPMVTVTDQVTGKPKEVEVDARLRDGTLVEVKYDTGGFAYRLGEKGLDQLILRKWSQPSGVPVALVTNFPLHPDHTARAAQHGIPVFRVSPSGGKVEAVPAPAPGAQPLAN